MIDTTACVTSESFRVLKLFGRSKRGQCHSKCIWEPLGSATPHTTLSKTQRRFVHARWGLQPQ